MSEAPNAGGKCEKEIPPKPHQKPTNKSSPPVQYSKVSGFYMWWSFSDQTRLVCSVLVSGMCGNKGDRCG